MTIKNSVQMYPGKLFIEAFRGTFLLCDTGDGSPCRNATGRTVPSVAFAHFLVSRVLNIIKV